MKLDLDATTYYQTYVHEGRAALVWGRPDEIFGGGRQPKLWLCRMGKIGRLVVASDLSYLARVKGSNLAQRVIDTWRKREDRRWLLRKLKRKLAEDGIISKADQLTIRQSVEWARDGALEPYLRADHVRKCLAWARAMPGRPS